MEGKRYISCERADLNSMSEIERTGESWRLHRLASWINASYHDIRLISFYFTIYSRVPIRLLLVLNRNDKKKIVSTCKHRQTAMHWSTWGGKSGFSDYISMQWDITWILRISFFFSFSLFASSDCTMDRKFEKPYCAIEMPWILWSVCRLHSYAALPSPFFLLNFKQSRKRKYSRAPLPESDGHVRQLLLAAWK